MHDASSSGILPSGGVKTKSQLHMARSVEVEVEDTMADEVHAALLIHQAQAVLQMSQIHRKLIDRTYLQSIFTGKSAVRFKRLTHMGGNRAYERSGKSAPSRSGV